jgi:hypothetical protein
MLPPPLEIDPLPAVLALGCVTVSVAEEPMLNWLQLMTPGAV